MKPHKSFKVGREGVILGVFDEPEMVYMISCGKVLGTDDYWTEGMSTWGKVSSRATWTVTGASPVAPSAESIVGHKPAAFSPVSGADDGIRNPEATTQVSFFTIWWKTALGIYVASACLGFLNSGGYGLGYALGGGVLLAPLSALFFGGIIYAFSKK
jgi:hypothetical protein